MKDPKSEGARGFDAGGFAAGGFAARCLAALGFGTAGGFLALGFGFGFATDWKGRRSGAAIPVSL